MDFISAAFPEAWTCRVSPVNFLLTLRDDMEPMPNSSTVSLPRLFSKKNKRSFVSTTSPCLFPY
jgi:hypothetical protein